MNSPTWKLLEQRWDQGFDSLMKEEKEAIALWWLEAETMNGTLDQFFWNSSGDLALIAKSGLESLRMPITLCALQTVLDYFGPCYPTNREQRMEQLEQIQALHGEEVFISASRIIQDLPEDFVQAAVNRLTTIYVY